MPNDRSWGNRLLLTLIFSLLLLGICIPTFLSMSRVRTDQVGQGYRCSNNLKQLGLAMHLYNQDYSELPLVESEDGSSGWAEALLPYARQREVFQCPQQGTESSSVPPTAIGYTDYWMNARFSGYDLGKVRNSDHLFLMGDGNDGRDVTSAHYSISGLPAQWVNDVNSPLYRHAGEGTMLFVDGHVKRMSAFQIAQGSAGTF